MNEKKYEILDQTGHTIAYDMDLSTALLLMKALCEEYYETHMDLRLKEIFDHD